MIVAKAADMGLVVFAKVSDLPWQERKNQSLIEFSEEFEYFLCLPQHKEAVLNVLNGGESQLTLDGATWDKCNLNQPVEWSESWWCMKGESQSRIKPEKGKRWIGYCASRNQTIPHPQDSEQLAMDYTALRYSYHVNEWQFIEIEVEVAGVTT
jgi:hypothetical protein